MPKMRVIVVERYESDASRELSEQVTRKLNDYDGKPMVRGSERGSGICEACDVSGTQTSPNRTCIRNSCCVGLPSSDWESIAGMRSRLYRQRCLLRDSGCLHSCRICDDAAGFGFLMVGFMPLVVLMVRRGRAGC